jgi:hypothetical protein
MGGYPTEFAGSTQNVKKIGRTSNQPIKTKIYPKKVCLVPTSVNELKIRMGATRQNLQAQPKILKKIIGTPNVPIKTKICPKNECLVP